MKAEMGVDSLVDQNSTLLSAGVVRPEDLASAGAREAHGLRTRLGAVVACASGAALVALYLSTACSTVYWYDSAELAAEATALGVPHPPGYPLYTPLAHLFTWLPGEPAWGVTLMSVVFAGVSALLLFAVARRLGASILGAATATLLFGTSHALWANAVVAEVYAPGIAFTLAVLLSLLEAHARKDPRWLIAAGLVAGLGLGMHLSLATCGLGFLWLVLRWQGKDQKPWNERSRLWWATAGAVVLGLSVFAYIPLSKAASGADFSASEFFTIVSGGEFQSRFITVDFWQRAGLVGGIFVQNLGWFGLALGLLGLLCLWRQRAAVGVACVLAVAGNVWWFFNYVVPDPEGFYLPSIAFLCVGAGIALDWGTAILARKTKAARALAWGGLALPLSNLHQNFAELDRSTVTEASDYGRAACASMERPAVVVQTYHPEEWRYYSVFLYVQKALHQCEDVTIWYTPEPARLRARLSAVATPIYAFRPLETLARDAELEQSGVLWRLRPLPHDR